MPHTIQITPTLAIDASEIHIAYVHSSGPGGQNVNKVATAAQLRFDVDHSPSLPQDVRQRLVEIAGKRVSKEGWLVIDARHYRTQERNRQDALERFADLVRQAAEKPKQRRKTKPSAEAKQRRREEKKKRSQVKRLRSTPPSDY